MVRRRGGELGGARVHGLVDRPDAQRVPDAADDVGAHPADLADLQVGEAVPLGQPQQLGRQLGGGRHLGGDLVDQHQLVDEPRVDRGGLEDLLGRGAGPDRVHHVLEPAVVRDAGLLEQRLLVELHPLLVPVERRVLALQGAQRLLQRLGEVAADRHRLADGLHVGGQRGVGGRELLEREPRHLHHDVVERRLEADAGVSPVGRDVVGDLVEGVADRHLRRDLGDREAGRLARPGRWSARRAGSSRSRPRGRRAG